MSIEWSQGQDPDVTIDVWNTAALLEAVLTALLEEPDAMAKAMRLLQDPR
jgi:hypothetical protein